MAGVEGIATALSRRRYADEHRPVDGAPTGSALAGFVLIRGDPRVSPLVSVLCRAW